MLSVLLRQCRVPRSTPTSGRLLSTSASNILDEHLLHRSPVHTEFFQASLPHLKVPDLNASVEKYLNSQRPLLTDEQFSATTSICQEFLKQDGPELQRLLLDYDKSNSDGNYVSDFWFDMYLRDRRSLVLNHTPFLAFSAAPEQPDPLDRLTNMVYSSARYQLTYANRVLKPEVYFLDPKLSEEKFYQRMKMLSRIPGHSRLAWAAAYLHKAFPLDMSQYPNLMASTRLPQTGRDSLRRYPDSRHIVLMRGGRFYSFDIIEPDGLSIVPASTIRARLSECLADSRPAAEFPVGVLTSADRDVWTKERQKLAHASKTNSASLEAIDSALFLVCLDESQQTSDSALCHAFLHSGDGANRWWDKSLCLMAILPVGEFAVSFEHSWGDGVAVSRYFNEVCSTTRIGQSESLAADSASVRRLEFDLDDSLKASIATCREQLSARTADLDLDFWQFDGFGKSSAKRAGLSPDSVSQTAIQLAYYWLSGGATAPTYESCSTAAFRRGRTETIRSATSATKEFLPAGRGQRARTDRPAAGRAEGCAGTGTYSPCAACRSAVPEAPSPRLFTRPGLSQDKRDRAVHQPPCPCGLKIGGFAPPGWPWSRYAIEDSFDGAAWPRGVQVEQQELGSFHASSCGAYQRACLLLADVIWQGVCDAKK
uniref:Carn_acyltransf domain-containing protein n=1 Tax=Macrostomum lignano TaxID=282301 RepID=A0A1I8F3I5_9PLAT